MSFALTFFCPFPVHPIVWAQWDRIGEDEGRHE